jgi:thiosulfate reductase / polysulfide reductase chain A
LACARAALACREADFRPTRRIRICRRAGPIRLETATGADFFRLGPLSKRPIEDLTAWYEGYLSNELKNGAPKITLEELKRLPGAVWVDKGGTLYEKFAEPIPPDKLSTAFIEGDFAAEGTAIYDKPKDKGGKRIGTVAGGKPVRGFFTSSGKIEFYKAALAKKRDAAGHPVDPLAVYRPRDWQPSAEFPLYLINWKEASHTHTRTQNNAWLLELKPSNPLIIARATAGRLGIRDGDQVWVESKFGRTRAAKVSDRIHPEVVGAQHGFGHRKLGKLAASRGSSFGDLNFVGAFDAISGQGLHKEICVKVYKV